MQQFALLLSGRVSADLMQKVICAGIPVVISIGAPSSLAIELAESVGIILIGFVKKSTCNVYAGKQQLDLNQPISLKE
jgi:FdhD protein